LPYLSDDKINKVRVLFVDDEPDLHIILEKFLELIDPLIQIDSAYSSEDVLKVFNSYDCILADYKLPKMNGIELARKIRETSNIPFILYTGYDSEELSTEALKAGVDACIRKDLGENHYQALAAKIRFVIEKQVQSD
jgi:CheY-like chemotaxis protein